MSDPFDWHPLDDYAEGTWVVLDYPEYRVYGRVAQTARTCRLGLSHLVLDPAWEVGVDQGPEGARFSSPKMNDCRPSRRMVVSSEGLRRHQLCEDRWETWPGKDQP